MHVSFGDGTRDDGAFPSEEICSYQSAQIAAEGRDYVTSLDTKVVTAVQCAIVVRVARLLEEHPDWGLEQAVPAAEELIRRSRLCFIPDELEYLRAGGRVSNAVALCGKLLGIHPRIELLDGRLVATKKPRGRIARLPPGWWRNLPPRSAWSGTNCGWSGRRVSRMSCAPWWRDPPSAAVSGT